MHEDARIARQRLAFGQCVSGCPAARHQPGKVRDDEPRMSLARRAEFAFHAEMNLELTALEPAATALRHVGRFWNFGNSEHTVIELACLLLAAGRHRQLHMVETSYRHDRQPCRSA